MVNAVAKYLFKSYCLLYISFGNDDFDFQNAVKVLRQSEKYTGQILSKLEKGGWISKRQEIYDARNKIYQLNKIEKIIEKIGKETRDEK